MLDSARRPARWAAAIALTTVAGLFPSVATTSSADAAWSGDACGVKLAKPTGGAWTCSFVDDFSGRQLDTAKWGVNETAKSGFRVGEACLRNDVRNVSVGSGTLRLTTRREGSAFVCKSPYGDFSTSYTGADISTSNKFSQTYGRFEYRVKFPNTRARGLHANAWMNPQAWTYGAWPNSGEIDVAEWFSFLPAYAIPSLHYNGRTDADSSSNCLVGDLGSFHTYTIQWTSTVMTFAVDGKACFSRVWAPESPQFAPAPFDKPFYLSLSVGTGAGPNAPSNETLFPATMYVDYVKAWY